MTFPNVGAPSGHPNIHRDPDLSPAPGSSQMSNIIKLIIPVAIAIFISLIAFTFTGFFTAIIISGITWTIAGAADLTLLFCCSNGMCPRSQNPPPLPGPRNIASIPSAPNPTFGIGSLFGQNTRPGAPGHRATVGGNHTPTVTSATGAPEHHSNLPSFSGFGRTTDRREPQNNPIVTSATGAPEHQSLFSSFQVFGLGSRAPVGRKDS